VTAKLDATNYLQWSYEMEHAILCCDLWGLVVTVGSLGAEPKLNEPLRSGEGAYDGAAEPLGHGKSKGLWSERMDRLRVFVHAVDEIGRHFVCERGSQTIS